MRVHKSLRPNESETGQEFKLLESAQEHNEFEAKQAQEWMRVQTL